MKHGDKVYCHRKNRKQVATWICWITRSNSRVAMIKVRGSRSSIEVLPSEVEIGRLNNGKSL